MNGLIKLLIYAIIIVIGVIACISYLANSSKSVKELAAEEMERRRQMMEIPGGKVTGNEPSIEEARINKEVALSYKELILGDNIEKCIEKALQNGMTKEISSITGEEELRSDFLQKKYFIKLKEYKGLIYEISLNHTEDDWEKIDSLYIGKYGQTKYYRVPQEFSVISASNTDWLTVWDFNNQKVSILYSVYHRLSSNTTKGVIITYFDKTIYAQRQREIEEQDSIRDEIRKEEEMKMMKEARERESHYSEDI